MQTILLLGYGFANVYIMFWIGYGGLERLPPVFQSVFVVGLLYLLLLIAVVYLALARTSTETRNSIRKAIFAPWALVLLLCIPQFGHDPRGVLIICIEAALVWFIYIPGERLVGWLRKLNTEAL